MLPLHESQPRTSSLGDYARRVLRYQHMDFEYTFWQMLFLCFNPRRIYRTALYHSRTKHQWARDDPAFVVTLLYLLLVATLSWLVAFDLHSFVSVLRLFLYEVLVDFLGVDAFKVFVLTAMSPVLLGRRLRKGTWRHTLLMPPLRRIYKVADLFF